MPIENESLHKLISVFGNLEEKEVLEHVLMLREKGISSREIQQCLILGMDLVKRYYHSGEYFIGDLIYGSFIYEQVLDLKVMNKKSSVTKINIALATLEGDLYNLEKNILMKTLSNNGFRVSSLGTLSANDSFDLKSSENHPSLYIISCKLDVDLDHIKKLISNIKRKSPSSHIPKILLGGAPRLLDKWGTLGADKYYKDELDCLDYCLAIQQDIINGKK